MSANAKLTEVVRDVLKTKARDGQTTKRDAVILVLGKIQKLGGATAIGIGAAAIRMALAYLAETEIERQFKSGLTAHQRTFILPPSTPDDVAKTLGKIPAWIATDEGQQAIWRYSLKASRDDWAANALLKEKKARQTAAKANMSMDVARFLTARGVRTLEEALGWMEV